jgi:ComF family protein
LRGPTLPADRLCGACRRRPPPWRRLLTLWDYAPPADEILRALKFHRVEGLAERIAEAAWDRHAEELAGSDALVAVPLPWTRRMTRGFNQTEEIARPLARRLGVELSSPLRRAPSRALSSADPAERRRRALRSFRLRPGARLPRRVLLVDDVFTTGATLDVVTRLLRRAGARDVVALTPFWTPRGLP